MRNTIFCVLFFLLALSSCSKEKSKRWMVIDLTITSSLTGNPINAQVEIERTVGSYIPMGEDQPKREKLGVTKGGHYYYELPISSKDYNWELILLKGGWYVGGSFYMDSRISLNPSKKNVLEVVWTPTHYLTTLKLNNSDCHDDADSLWVSYLSPYSGEYINEKIFEGCVDNVQYLLNNDRYLWSPGATSTFKYRSIKNGIETSGALTFDLEPEIVNEFVLEY